MVNPNPQEQFYAFLERRSGSPNIMVAPYYGNFFCTSRRNGEWVPLMLNSQVIEDWLACGQEAGILSIVCLGWWDLNPFGWMVEEISRDENHRRFARVIRGNSGTLRHVFEEQPKVGCSTIQHPVQNIDDYRIVEESLDHLDKNRDQVMSNMIQTVRQVGQRGVVHMTVPLPHLVFGLVSGQQLVFDLADYPDRLSRIFERCFEAGMKLIDMGLEAGIRLFFCSTHGYLGPRILKDYCLPYAVKLREKLHAKNAFMYLHECGKMKALIENGFYNAIGPDILEGFDRSPVGDVDDLRWARKQLDSKTIFKGNLRLEDVKNGPPERIRRLCRETLDSVEGYRHILGTSCSVIYGTPLEHVRVFSEFSR